MNKRYVLWIEDDATYNLQYIAAPVVMSPKYDLTLAVTVSEALHHLQSRGNGFDALVVDLRLPPGRQREWIKLHQQLGRSGAPPRLGLDLLLNLYDHPTPLHEVSVPQIDHLPPIQQVGILSVDPWTAVQESLEGINFNKLNYQQKSAGMSSQVLLQLVEHIANGV